MFSFQSLEDQFEKIQQSNLKIHQAWLQSKTPGEIERANAARSKLKNHFKMKIPARRMLIKDDRIPKKPSAPYNYFFRSRYASAHAGLPVVEAARLIAEKWTTLTDAEKAVRLHANNARAAFDPCS